MEERDGGEMESRDGVEMESERSDFSNNHSNFIFKTTLACLWEGHYTMRECRANILANVLG